MAQEQKREIGVTKPSIKKTTDATAFLIGKKKKRKKKEPLCGGDLLVYLQFPLQCFYICKHNNINLVVIGHDLTQYHTF